MLKWYGMIKLVVTLPTKLKEENNEEHGLSRILRMDDSKINLLREMQTFSMRVYDFYVYHVAGNEYEFINKSHKAWMSSLKSKLTTDNAHVTTLYAISQKI